MSPLATASTGLAASQKLPPDEKMESTDCAFEAEAHRSLRLLAIRQLSGRRSRKWTSAPPRFVGLIEDPTSVSRMANNSDVREFNVGGHQCTEVSAP